MKKDEKTLYKFESLTDFHRVFGLQKPVHPLISFIDISCMQYEANALPDSIVMDYYKISYKTSL